MRQRLEVRQSQQLVMTPQLRQAISMLQMSTVELSAFVAEAVERNPLLSMGEPETSRPAAPPAKPARTVDETLRDAGPGALNGLGAGRENVFDAGSPPPPRLNGGARGGGEGDLDAMARVAAGESLADLVRAQIACARLPAAARLVAETLAVELDDAGYLRVATDEAATRLGVAAATVEAAVAAIQACAPTGVGARSLAECLALQLAERDRLDPAMQALLDRLESVPHTPAAVLAAACGVDVDDIADMLAEIRALDPRPGLSVGGGTAQPVAPEVLVTPDPAGGWRVELNAEAMPRLIVDRAYAARVGRREDRETRLYIAECRQNASWLQRSLDQRARSILAVAAEIVRAQPGFLERGVAGLRPMTLRDVAEAVSLHESTVSRVTANKFMATPRGVIEMKAFFSTALAAADGGDAHSAAAVRDRIRAMVDAEPPGKPLSDEHIMAALKRDGVDVARRTVAKYRESLNIPSSVERRRRAKGALS